MVCRRGALFSSVQFSHFSAVLAEHYLFLLKLQDSAGVPSFGKALAFPISAGAQSVAGRNFHQLRALKLQDSVCDSRFW